MGEWAALPPERNCAGFWCGPGAGSFFSSAATLEALAALLLSILGGHEAAAGAQGAAWDSPAGAVSLAANIPYQAWIADAAGQLAAAAAQIQATGEGFEMLKAATDTPAQVAENQAEHVALNLANICNILFPLIVANRAEYTRKWVTAASNMYSYSALSAAGVQSIPPLPPPIPTGTPSAAGAAGDAAQAASDKPLEQALGPNQSVNTLMPLLNQLVSAPAQVAQIGGGSQLLSGFTQLPQQALSPFQSMLTGFTGAGAGLDAPGVADAAAGSWITATPAAGGPVSAALSGGSGGLSGFGAVTSASSALRGPVSWSSTVAASPSTPESATAISRIAEARTASAMPSSMGSSGAMMAPLAHGAGRDSQNASPRDSGTLLAAATLYRPPEGLPVVTGGSGAQFGSGEEDHQS